MSTNYFRKLRMGSAVGAALLTFVLAPPAFAAGVNTNNLFELGPGVSSDENGLTNILGDNNTANGPDWADLFQANGDPTTPNDANHTAVFIKDDISAGSLIDQTVYSGGPGDKNSDLVQHWTWGGSSVPVKDDVGNAYAYAVTDTDPNSPTFGHLIIYVGAERLSNNGDAHIDVEFFQSPVALDRDPPCPNGKCRFTGSNTNGDLLVNLDFTNGGAFAGLTVRERQSGATNNYVQVGQLSAQGCNAAFTSSLGFPVAAGSLCAFTNGGSIAGGPWPNFDSHGAVVDSLPTNAFAEYGLDVTALFNKSNLCFSTVQVKTRSSQSFTATLKDFALHKFQSCVASAKTQVINNATGDVIASDDPSVQGNVPSGTVIHDKAIVSGTQGGPTPTGTVTFHLFNDLNCGNDGGADNILTSNAPLANDGTAVSDNYTTSGGTPSISFQATYNGDSVYNPVTSGCERLTVAKGNVTIMTDILNASGRVMNKIVQNGDTIHDTATVTGTLTKTGGGYIEPTGTVTFTLYGTANCSGSAITQTQPIHNLDGGANTADGIATATSDTYTPNNPAGSTLSYTAVYSGDNNYNGSTVSTCEPTCAIPFCTEGSTGC